MADSMPLPRAPKVLAIVQAGGKGSRMGALTADRAKPALPFGGTHQLIDITLSNVANSGIGSVWVSVQYQAGSLDEHLQHGRPWDLDRNVGGFRRVVPDEVDAVRTGGFAAGNADDLYRIRREIEREDADVVVVLSADQIFALDLRDVIAAHLETGAACTIVTTQVSRSQASDKAVVITDATGKVTRVEEKPENPESTTISAEIFVYEKDALLLGLDKAEKATRPDDGKGDDAVDETGLGDFAEHLLPQIIADGLVRTYPLEGYWKDMGRPELYLAAHRDLVRGVVRVFDDVDWPMRTLATNRGAARVRAGAVVEESVISPGCDIAGTVRGSTLGPGVVVREGAVVEDSVIFDACVIERDAVVSTSILDANVAVRAGVRVGTSSAGKRAHDDAIAVVGHDSVVRSDVVAGSQIDPGSTVA